MREGFALYASMFSAFYLALFIVLVALIVRGVSFEFRGKRATRAWRVGCLSCWSPGCSPTSQRRMATALPEIGGGRPLVEPRRGVAGVPSAQQ